MVGSDHDTIWPGTVRHMTADVIEPDFITSLDIPVERVLRKAGDAELDTVVVIGWGKDGELYFSSSVADGGDVLWMLEKTKAALLVAGEGDG